MIAFFTVCYCLAIWLFFVKMKIKPNPTNVAVASVVGVVAISLIVVFWRFSAPNSSELLVSRYTVQLVPQVKGPITKLYAEPNVPLKGGVDKLFEIQRDIYVNTVDQIAASLEASRNDAEELEAAVRAAQAAVTRSEADLEAVAAELQTALALQKSDTGAIAELRVKQVEAQHKAAEAAVDQSIAAEEQSLAGLAEAQSTIRSLEAELANAQFSLDQCVVYAPADGFVTNWQVREGTMSVPLPLSPIGTFIDTTTATLVASFPQNICKFVEPGQAVEISLKTRPGEVFTGKVTEIVQATGEGQFVTSGQLLSASDLESSGQFIVKFDLDDDELERSLALGTAGTVAIYTDRGKPFHVISKVVVRMNAWMYYLNPF